MGTRRRGLFAALLVMLVVLALTAGGWRPAAGNEPEGPSDGPQVNVVPSDNLPSFAGVTVSGTRFVPVTAQQNATVVVEQCIAQLDACGPAGFLPVSANGTFSGPFTATRLLTLRGTTYDCVVEVCEVRVSGDVSGRHHLTFARAQPTVPSATATTRPAGVTTTTPGGPAATTSTTRRSATTTTVRRRDPGTTTTTTVALTATSTTAAPPTTTTVPSTTTTTALPPAPDDRPPLVAVTPKDRSSGPPGGGLQVTGTGYTCETVYFFFDGTRIGSDAPDGAGNVRQAGLSVPGDARTGRHQVSSSCEPSGEMVEQAAFFEVVPASVHRPAFLTALALPDQVSLDPGQLLFSAAVAIGAILLIAFPYELFNSTMEENYDEIRSWFGLGRRGVREGGNGGRTLAFFALTALSAVACGFLSPDFGLNATSVVLALGFFAGMLVMAVVFSLPADVGIHRRFGEWGKLNFLPGSVIVSIVLVLLSRLFDFQPGYFYGALAGLAFRSALTEKDQGRMTAANWLFSLLVSVGAFFLRAPVSEAAAEPGSSVWWIGLEACLALIFLWGVEGLAVAMLPMRFLDGRKVLRWSRTAWAVLFFVGVFATVHVLLRPGSGYVGETSGAVTIGVMVLYALFGLGSAAFWAYFRYRPQRWVPAGP